MAKSITKYTVFLGSPGDLEEERFEVENAIKELNLTYASRNNLILELLKWETHSAPGISNAYTQDLINKDIGNDYDIFIGLLWQKFGTKTNVANSGTEEEFLNAIKRFENKENIQILFYFKNKAPLSLSEINIDELSKINKFKEILKENKVLYSSFNDVDELKANLRMHLPTRIDDLISKDNVDINKVEIVDTNEVFLENDDVTLEEDLGLFDYLIEFENLLSNGTAALINISEITKNIGEEFIKKSEEIERINKYPNPNKVVIIELLKRVSRLMDDYSERLKLENVVFYNNFKDAIDIGLKYINSMEYMDKDQYEENLISTLKSTEALYATMPGAINGIYGFHDAIKTFPALQSNLNKSKRILDKQLEEFIFSLKGARNLTNEFISEIKYKLSRIQ